MNLYVSESGERESPTIVLLHGGGWSGWMWDRHKELLNDYYCLVPDLPGHGRSKNITPFTMKFAAEQVIDIVRNKAKDGKAYLVGFSLGAQVALEILNKAPDIISGAIISSALARRMPYQGVLINLMQFSLLITQSKKFRQRQARELKIPNEEIARYHDDAKYFQGEIFRQVVKANFNQGLPAGLTRLKVPTLILVGQKEPGIMKNSAKDLVDKLPNAKGYIIKNARHTYCYENPIHFAQIVDKWVRDQVVFDESLEPIY